MTTSIQSGDKNIYYVSFYSVESSLLAEKQYFDSRAKNALSMSDRTEAIAVSIRVSNEIGVLRAQLDTFISKHDKPGLPPPSAEMVERSKKLSDNLAQDLLKANSAKKVLLTVASFMALWGKLLSMPVPDLSSDG